MLSSQRLLPSVGDRVGGCEILAPIAEGGMAAVFDVRGPGGETLALKLLLPHLTKDRAFVDMVLDEARITRAIRHRNVVRIVESGEDQGLPFLVMERLEGGPLSAVVASAAQREATIPWPAVLNVLAMAATGLHAAHEARDASGAPLGIVHRDVSPQNVHIGRDGRVVVLDFGIAAARGRLTQTRTGEIKGKFQYLAPEQITREAAIDRRCDVWALGVLAYQLLAGVSPFRGEDDATTLWNVMHRELAPLASVRPDVPAEAAALVDRCLRRAPRERPGDAQELATVWRQAALDGGVGDEPALAAILAPWLAPAPSAALPPTRIVARAVPSAPVAPAVPGRPPSTRGAIAFAVAAIALGLSGVGAWMWRGAGAEAPRVAASPAPVIAQGDSPASRVTTDRVPALAVETPAPRRDQETAAPAPAASAGGDATDADPPVPASRRHRPRGSRRAAPSASSTLSSRPSPLLADPY